MDVQAATINSFDAITMAAETQMLGARVVTETVDALNSGSPLIDRDDQERVMNSAILGTGTAIDITG